MASTLIETININADDFTDNFLTCPTCMGPYDEQDHTPKLLPCSHTLCKSCLDRIASSTALPVPATSSPSTSIPQQQQQQTQQQQQQVNPVANQASQLIGHHSNSISRSIAVADAAAAAINNNSNTAAAISQLTTNGSRQSLNNQQLQQQQPPVIDLFIRCPICRETITLPRNGGVSNLPPSFIINQLLDLVKNQRRDLVPRCKNHTNEELLFCETCDQAFCSICESHCRVVSNADHIVIPFSIAIKRMTEIFLFKSNQCINSFNLALNNVQSEIENLNQTVENVALLVDNSFAELKQVIERRREELIRSLLKIKDSKTKVLREQMQLILNEKQKVELECKEYHQSNMECRYLGAQIEIINEKLDCLRSLCEPRENSFINYEYKFNNSIEMIEQNVKKFGKFNVSNTYPPLCTAKLIDDINDDLLSNTNGNNSNSNSINKTYSANLAIQIQIQTVDYYGQKRVEGGDPVSILITDPFGRQQLLESFYQEDQTENQTGVITDLKNGLYTCKFTPNTIGKYRLDVTIFKRSIYQMPIFLNVVEHMDSLWTFGGGGGGIASGMGSLKTNSLLKNNLSSNSFLMGSAGFSSNKGNSDKDFNMPISVRCLNNLIYVLDSGNNRIKVLNNNGQFMRHLYHNGLNESSCTSLITNSLSIRTKRKINLYSINWRLKLLSNLEIALENTSQNDQQNFVDKHEALDHFEEPIGLAETFHPNIFLLQDRKKLNLCTSGGIVLVESLDSKMKLECGIKNITSYCGSLIKRRIYIAEHSNHQLNIYEFDLDWLTDYKLDSLIEKHRLNENITNDDLITVEKSGKFTFRKFQPNQTPQSTSLTSLTSNISLNATITTTATSLSSNANTTLNGGSGSHGGSGGAANKGTYTAMWHDMYTNKLLAAKCDKQKTVIELYNSNTYLYEYSIECSQMEKNLKRVTSLCCTKDGRVVCVDLVQNLVKMFRFI